MPSSSPPIDPSEAPSPADVQASPLETLANRRGGGAEAIKGFVYQTRYAALRLLKELLPDEVEEAVEEPVAEPASEGPVPEIHKSIMLEGLEDVDVIQITRLAEVETDRTRECVQAKCSLNTWNAHSFSETGVLHNFVEAYLLDPALTFRIVHSAPLPQDGALAALVQSIRTGQPLTGLNFHYWKNHIDDYRQGKGRRLDWTRFSMNDFLQRITFEQIEEDDLISQLRHQITTKFELKADYDQPYVNALLWATLVGSRDRQEITVDDIRTLVDAVTQDIIKGHSNEVVRKSWLTPVSFDEKLPDGEEEAYFEGKAARPSHIAADIPVRRLHWETQIREIFDENDVTLIRASSGQGKSTLAWCVINELSDEGWTPYEVEWCADEKEVGQFVQFLKSRVRLGEQPLLIFDGLRTDLKAWVQLVNRIRDLPVKAIVTSREEDWYRFGAEPEKLRLRHLTLEMSEEEAKAVYESFEAKGKIHPKAPKFWQTAWEQVQETGLLIEYVSFITSGQMLADRMNSQIKALTREPDSGARLEILRLVSLADVCGLRLNASRLLDHVRSTVGFQGDRGEILESLRREYYLSLDGPSTVTGLHPVRSRHLLSRLHRSLPLSDTLIAFLQLIGPDDLFYFCAQAPLMLDAVDRPHFLTALAEHCSKKPYPEMIHAIEGTFIADALLHCDANRALYAKVASVLSDGVSLVALDTFPWSGVDNVVDGRAATSSPLIYPSWQVALDVRGQIQPFEPSSSFIIGLLTPLQRLISKDSFDLNDWESIVMLEFWFNQLGLPSPMVSRLDAQAIWDLVEDQGLDDLGPLFNFLHSAFPDVYEALMTAHRVELFERFCAMAGVLRMWDDPHGLHLEYFPDPNQSVAPGHITTKEYQAYLFFPGYGKYFVKFNSPPAPFMIQQFRTSSDCVVLEKYMAASHFFHYRLIALWARTIIREHESPSVYEWQQQWMDFRQRLIVFAERVIAILEAELECNPDKAKVDPGEFDIFLHLRAARRLKTNLHPDLVDPFLEQEKEMINAVFSWVPFLGEFPGLLSMKNPEMARCLDYLRRFVRLRWPRFQRSYRTILQGVSTHFDPTDLEAQENEWYGRLYEIASFLAARPLESRPISSPRQTARRYFEERRRQLFEAVRSRLDDVEAESGLRFTLFEKIFDAYPDRIIAIGLHVSDFVPPETLPSAFSTLAEVEGVDVFCLHLIDEQGQAAPFYFPFHKAHLQGPLNQRNAGRPQRIATTELTSIKPSLKAILPELASLKLDLSAFAAAHDFFICLFRFGQVSALLEKNPDSERFQRLADDLNAQMSDILVSVRADHQNEPFFADFARFETLWKSGPPYSDRELLLTFKGFI